MAAVQPAPESPLSRTRALAEVILCSGYPTQFVLIAGLTSAGIRPTVGESFSPAFVLILSGLDTVLLLGLVFLLLHQSRQSPQELFLGRRPLLTEVAVGVLTVPALLATVIALQLVIRVCAPSLHNVEVTPFLALFQSPWLLAAFVGTVLLAGGIREEVQRAFLLNRFEHGLGGIRTGLVLTSASFGLGHAVQGVDAMLLTTVMGAFWGVTFIRRRSIVANVTSHALFNVAQILAGYATIARAYS